MGRHSHDGVDVTTRPAEAAQAPASPDAGLASRAGSSVAWSALSRILIQVVQLATTSVLARIIAPEQFGLVALVMVFVGFAWIFSDLGVGAAVVHRKDPDQVFLSTAFWLNTVAGFVLTGLMVALSPLIAWFFNQSALIVLVVVASGNYTVAMFAVHSALLQKQLRFKAIGVIEFSAVLVYAGTAIALGVAGFGALALVLGSLIQALVTTLLFWGVVRWRPTSFISRRASAEIWRFSGGLVGFNTVNYWTRNLDNLALGRFSTPVDLAFYSRAYNLMLLPVTQMNVIVGRVLFPVLTLVRDDPQRLRRAYLRILRVIAALACPVSVLLATAASSVVSVLYGPKWAGTAPLLTALAIGGLPQFIGLTCGPLYQALGQTGAQFRRSLWSAAGTLAAVAFGLPWGAQGVAIALAIRFYVLLPVITSGAWRGIDLELSQALWSMRGCLLASLAMGAVCIATRIALPLDNPSALLLLAQAVLGLVTYLGVLRLIDRSQLAEIFGLLARHRPRS